MDDQDGTELAELLRLAVNERDEIAELNHRQFLELEYLRRVYTAAARLYIEAKEYDFHDGMGQGAEQAYWDELAAALEPETDAIAEVMRAGSSWASEYRGGGVMETIVARPGVTWKTCSSHGDENPNIWGCPECLRELRTENEHLRSVLQDLRIRLYTQGRRPEECHEMSLIDDALTLRR